MTRLAVVVAALALTGCASSRLPAETPDGSALDVATLVRQTAADTAGALAGGATPARVQEIWGDAIEAHDEALRTVPSATVGKPPLLDAAAATAAATHALGSGDPTQARALLAQAHADLVHVADALGPRLPDRAGALERLREPLG